MREKVINVMVAAIVLLAVAALFYVLLFSTASAPAPQRHDRDRDRALQVARERLTAGDIDAAQYSRIIQALRR